MILGRLMTVFAGATVRALASGTVDRDGLASLASEVARALVGGPSADSTGLDRVEAKIDALARGPYELAMGTGVLHLRDVLDVVRSDGERLAIVQDARRCFVEAAAAARHDPARRAVAYLHLAGTHLARGSREDCARALRSARFDALHAASMAAASIATPPPTEVAKRASGQLTEWEKVRRMFDVTASTDTERRVRRELANEHRDRAIHLLEVFDVAHQGLVALRETNHGIRKSSITTPPTIPLVSVVLSAPMWDFAGLGIEISNIVMRRNYSPGAGVAVVDIEVRLRNQGSAKHDVHFLLEAARSTSATTVRPSLPLPPHDPWLTASLPGPALLASGRAMAPAGRGNVRPTSSVRGWIRLATAGEPRRVVVAIDPFRVSAPRQPGSLVLWFPSAVSKARTPRAALPRKQ